MINALKKYTVPKKIIYFKRTSYLKKLTNTFE